MRTSRIGIAQIRVQIRVFIFRFVHIVPRLVSIWFLPGSLFIRFCFFTTIPNSHTYNNTQHSNTANYDPNQPTNIYPTTFVFIYINRLIKKLICGNIKGALNWREILADLFFAFAFFFSQILKPTLIQITFMTRQVFD